MLIILTVFELLPKTCNFTICSIFSNSGHVGWCTASPNTILKLDTLVMIQTKFGFHWSCTFRGEDFWKSLRRTTDDGRRRRTPSDGNSSHDPLGYWVRWAKKGTFGIFTGFCHLQTSETSVRNMAVELDSRHPLLPKTGWENEDLTLILRGGNGIFCRFQIQVLSMLGRRCKRKKKHKNKQNYNW